MEPFETIEYLLGRRVGARPCRMGIKRPDIAVGWIITGTSRISVFVPGPTHIGVLFINLKVQVVKVLL
jgi:hypothetical protein